MIEEPTIACWLNLRGYQDILPPRQPSNDAWRRSLFEQKSAEPALSLAAQAQLQYKRNIQVIRDHSPFV
jgi:hypothetical protein